MTADEFATYDAAYVLGALSPEDRQAFEKHLQECDRCAAAVRELAGLPGLLAQTRGGSPGGADGPGEGGVAVTPSDPRPDLRAVPGLPASLVPEVPGSDLPGSGLPGSDVPVPDLRAPDLLPGLMRKVRRRRRTRNGVTGGAAALAVAAGVALAVSLSVPDVPPSPAAPAVAAPPPALAMSALGEYPIQAAARIDSQSWGTEVEMSCSYRGGKGGDYSLVALARDGTQTQLATWKALPENTAKVVVGTPMKSEDIASLEIRSVRTGKPLMRLVYP